MSFNITACIVHVAGFSGSGKTMLIEKALPELKRQGLYVGVLKHTHHNLSIDTVRKDTDRFFWAGADYVSIQDDIQIFSRFLHVEGDVQDALSKFPHGLDLIIVEGYKGADLPGVWLVNNGEGEDRHNAESRLYLYRNNPDYFDTFLEFIASELARHQAERPVVSGLLIGGKSSRMGRPKTMLEINRGTLVEHMLRTLSRTSQKTILLGSAELPATLCTSDRLPDAADGEGPLTGLLSAFRWAPRNTWIISAVDMPFMDEEAWQWLLSQRKPGVWAVVPRKEGSETIEATGACYEPMIFDYVESIARKGVSRLQSVGNHPKVSKPVIPKNLEKAWRNVNTREEWEKATAVLNG